MTQAHQVEEEKLRQAMRALQRLVERSEQYHEAGQWIGVCWFMGYVIDAAKDVRDLSRNLALKEMK